MISDARGIIEASACASNTPFNNRTHRPTPLRAGGHQCVDFVSGGYAVQGAEARAADRRGSVGRAQRVFDRLAVDQGVDETAAEHVAGAGRVDGVHMKRRLAMEDLAIERDSSLIAERDAQDAAICSTQVAK